MLAPNQCSMFVQSLHDASNAACTNVLRRLLSSGATAADSTIVNDVLAIPGCPALSQQLVENCGDALSIDAVS